MLTEKTDNWFRNEAPNTGASKQYPLEEARVFLKRAEQQFENDQVYHLLKWVRMACAQAGAPLSDFLEKEGTTENRINEIERVSYKSWAKIFLAFLRRWEGLVAEIDNIVSVPFFTNCVRMGVRHGNWTLEDLETSEEELLIYEERGKAKIRAMNLWISMSDKKKTHRDYKNPEGVAEIRRLLKEAVCRLDQVYITGYPINEEGLRAFEK
jgi:hypothetical protein